ncbi:MAG: hypothetical protein HOO67_05360 [Candidatus Peribacteraceae bacterium]|nr:hypothetical protein [Candidatus Peribacteraceae bacterium]
MQTYKNLSGVSGAASYEIGNDYIKVLFKDGKGYVYTYSSAGVQQIEDMKKLAANGSGLNTYINKYVKNDYESKF